MDTSTMMVVFCESGFAPSNPHCESGPGPSHMTYGSASATVAMMAIDFFSGTGPTIRDFGPQSAVSQVMAQSAQVQDVLSSYNLFGQTSGDHGFGLGGLYAAGNNSVAQFVGGFHWSITSASGGINLTITNTTSFRSLAADIGPWWHRQTFHPMGNTYQKPGDRREVLGYVHEMERCVHAVALARHGS